MCKNSPLPSVCGTFLRNAHSPLHTTPLRGLSAGHSGRSGMGRGVCVFLVCVVRMWLAPLTRHDLLTIPMVVRARHSAHITSLSGSAVGTMWKLSCSLPFPQFQSHYNTFEPSQ